MSFLYFLGNKFQTVKQDFPTSGVGGAVQFASVLYLVPAMYISEFAVGPKRYFSQSSKADPDRIVFLPDAESANNALPIDDIRSVLDQLQVFVN